MLNTFESLKVVLDGYWQKIFKARPDWSQNNYTADNYIKNRPFYETTTNSIYFEEEFVLNKFGTAYLNFSNVPYERGKTIYIELDGIEYAAFFDCDIEARNAIYIPLRKVENFSQDYYELPHIHLELGYITFHNKYPEDAIFIDDKSHTLKIYEKQTVVKKIDKKYLPDTIIDVVELPTENIDDNAFYRLLTAKNLALNGKIFDFLFSGCIVNGLPENASPANEHGQIIIYHNTLDNKGYICVDEVLAEDTSLPIGWHTLEELESGPLWGGIIFNIQDSITEAGEQILFLLAEYTIWSYKDGQWVSLSSFNAIGWKGTGLNSEIFNDISDNKAEGDYSHAEGSSTDAIGHYSHAEGFDTQAQGDYSHAEGQYTKAIGSHSHAEGISTEATGEASHAEGYSNEAQGRYSHAEGGDTTAIGFASHAEGFHTQAQGDYSHAEGQHTKAIGNHSHAEGDSTKAQGNYSHAEGHLTQATGENSHAEGEGTNAIGVDSHAEGQGTNAHGGYSHAEGYYTKAMGRAQHAQGEWNVIDPKYDTNNASKRGKYAHIVGNGTDINHRSNAHTLDWNGLGWFAGGLKVGGTGQDDSNAQEVALKSDIPSVNGLATESYVDTQLAALVNSAPDKLNTLDELAAALGDDENFANTVTGQIADKVSKSELDSVIESALTIAKESGEFDGKNGYSPIRGTDYFTETDKQEIAEQAAQLVEVPEVEIPTTLPNPNALTFTGAATGSYDGSKPMEIEIPESKEYTLPAASEIALGGVKASAKTEDMTQPVGISEDGFLFTTPGAGGESDWELLTYIKLEEESAISKIEYDFAYKKLYAILRIPRVENFISTGSSFSFLHAYGLYYQNIGDKSYSYRCDLLVEKIANVFRETFRNGPENGVGSFSAWQTRNSILTTNKEFCDSLIVRFEVGGTLMLPAGTILKVFGVK